MRFPLGGKAEYEINEVRALMPQGIKVKLSRETKWHTRWRASLPEFPTPNSTSKSFGGAIPEIRSIAQVVLDVHAIWHREGGPQCPYTDMDAVAGFIA